MAPSTTPASRLATLSRARTGRRRPRPSCSMVCVTHRRHAAPPKQSAKERYTHDNDQCHREECAPTTMSVVGDMTDATTTTALFATKSWTVITSSPLPPSDNRPGCRKTKGAFQNSSRGTLPLAILLYLMRQVVCHPQQGG